MTLQDIAHRTGIPIRLIRYVLDHRVLPGEPWTQMTDLRGQPRTVTDLEAFAISVAAHLLHAGVRRSNVQRTMSDLTGIPSNKTLPPRKRKRLFLADIQFGKESSRILVGVDGHIRVLSHGQLEVSGPSPDTEQDLFVRVEVDLAAIRNQLFAK